MKKIKFSLFVVAALLTTAFANAQSADSIISKTIDAIGGKAKMSAITSMYIESTTTVMGNENATKLTFLNGKGFKMETSFNGQPIIQCVTDKGGWMINPMMGSSDAQPLPDEIYSTVKDKINIGGPLGNYMAEGYKAELAGTEKIGDVNALKVKLTKGDATDTYYIDPNTYYILKSVMSTGGQETTSSFSDYKKTDFGYVIPYTTEIVTPQGYSVASTVTKVQFNQPVDPTFFDMPK